MESENSQGYSTENITKSLKNEAFTKRLLEAGERRANDMWERTKGLISKYVQPDQKILDVGVSLGQATKVFSEKLKLESNNVFSIDIANMSKEPSIMDGYALAKGEHLPYAKNTFDSVFFLDILHHTVDPEALLVEATRTLKPDGCIVLIENLLRDDLLGWQQELYKKMLFLIDNTSNAQESSVNPHSNHTLEEWRGLGEKLGLKLEEHVEWQWGLVDFVPGMTQKGNRETPSAIRPFTDSVMIFRIKDNNRTF
jgi:SAM-dependent methyltransferase